MPDFRDQGEQSKVAIGVDKLSFGQTSNVKRKQLSDRIYSITKEADTSNVMHDGSEQVQEIFPETTSTEVSRQRTHKGIWTSGELADTEQFMPLMATRVMRLGTSIVQRHQKMSVIVDYMVLKQR